MRRYFAVLILFITLTLLADSPAMTQNNEAIVITAPSGASLRSAPSTTGKKLATIPHLAEVTFVETGFDNQIIEGINGPWYKVRWQNQEGYIFSGLACSTPAEIAAINGHKDRVSREMATLFLKTADGKTVSLQNRPEYGEQSKVCRFRSLLPQNLFLVSQSGWEWGNTLIINANDGRSMELDADPIFSPDNRRFATANYDLEAGYTHNRIQIFSFVDGIGKLEWSQEPEDWGPGSAEWLDNDCLKVSVIYPHGSEAQPRVATRLIRYNSSGKTWEISDADSR